MPCVRMMVCARTYSMPWSFNRLIRARPVPASLASNTPVTERRCHECALEQTGACQSQKGTHPHSRKTWSFEGVWLASSMCQWWVKCARGDFEARLRCCFGLNTWETVMGGCVYQTIEKYGNGAGGCALLVPRTTVEKHGVLLRAHNKTEGG